jgi:antitoxin MazE
MVQSIRKIGNSNGVLIPKNMLLSCGISDQVDMQVMGDVIVIKSASQKPRENWNLAFENAINSEKGSEDTIFEEFENDFDKTEWTWE